jgi:two-component system, LytTR family, response regulator
MKKIRTILIDDEQDCNSLLYHELTQHCHNIEVVGTFTSSVKALEEIQSLDPDLVFLDIEMPQMNGFQFLIELMPVSFNVIFVTAYNQFALKAFRFNAVDYLLKPFDVNDLIEAVSKVDKLKNLNSFQLDQLQKSTKSGTITRLAIPSQQGVNFIEIKDILYAEASNNYTKIKLITGQEHIISKTLKDVQDVLEDMHFLRVHRQYIINIDCIKQFFRGENMYVVMTNDENIPIARSHKEKLVEKFGWL